MRLPRLTILLALLLLTAALYAAYHFKSFLVPSQREVTVTVVLKSLNVRSDFWQTVTAGAQVAAKQAGAVIVLDGPLQETDTDAQILALEQAIERKPDALVVAPFNDERMPELMSRIRQAGIPLVIMDTPLAIDPQPVFVGNDHIEAGRLAGQTAARETRDRPVAAILTDFNYSAISEQRMKGASEALSLYPDSLYGTYYSGDSEERAYDIAVSLLQDPQDFNAFITLTQSATIGAARAIQDTGKAGKVRLIGFDSSITEIQLLEEGIISATIVQKPFNMGYLSVKTALELAAGKRSAGNVTFIESTLVTRQNMYTPEIQKLLFPFIENQ
jgi:ribose transport system substrate-binding protein